MSDTAATLQALADYYLLKAEDSVTARGKAYNRALLKHVEIIQQDYIDGVYDDSSPAVESLLAVAAAAGITR